MKAKSELSIGTLPSCMSFKFNSGWAGSSPVFITNGQRRPASGSLQPLPFEHPAAGRTTHVSCPPSLYSVEATDCSHCSPWLVSHPCNKKPYQQACLSTRDAASASCISVTKHFLPRLHICKEPVIYHSPIAATFRLVCMSFNVPYTCSILLVAPAPNIVERISVHGVMSWLMVMFVIKVSDSVRASVCACAWQPWNRFLFPKQCGHTMGFLR